MKYHLGLVSAIGYCLLVTLGARADSPPAISLAGQWRFALDPDDLLINQPVSQWRFLETIQLPGKLTEQGFGNKPSPKTQWTGKILKYPKILHEWQSPDNFKVPFFLQPPLHYLGAAWYQRTISIPESWKGHEVRVMLERPHWETTLWLNERKAGGTNSLGTPHRYDLGELTPGEYTLTIRIDNRQDDVRVGGNAHSISDQTQGNWNGVVGRMELFPLAPNRVEHVDVYPKTDGTLTLVINGTGTRDLDLQISCGPLEEKTLANLVTERVDANGRFSKTVEVKVPFEPILWSEFSPRLYKVSISLSDDSPAFTTTFGFRQIENRDGVLTLNGKRIFLRGTLECSVFPRLGHPPTDVEPWRRIIRICKAYGLNHIRFHSWCPPEAAFRAADELGFYFQVEASAWSATVGNGGPFDAWLEAETQRMREEYGNHPSFLLMAYGNEPHGAAHVRHLTDWMKRQEQIDDRRLHTTGAGWPIVRGNGYHNPPQPRIQRWGEGLRSLINSKAPQTDFDFSRYVERHPNAPIVSHEIGQWCAYPNYKEIDKYTGFFKARNMEIFRETALRNGLLVQAEDFLRASGKWQVACYKHDIEAALRTPGFGGFQLLDLHDFPGQGTALVGVLDAFWESKGYIRPDEFRRFCSPSVALARFKKMVWTTNETLTAKVELAHFGPRDLHQSEIYWRLSDGVNKIASGQFHARDFTTGSLHRVGTLNVNLNTVAAPAQLKLTVGVEGSENPNSWDLFVYPPNVPKTPLGFVTTENFDEAFAALKKGSRVLWLVSPDEVADDPERPLQIGFSTIFWNTAYTNWQPPHTLGLVNQAKHPALAKFPTEDHTNWQYWDIVTRSRPFILTSHHELLPIIQPIDDWYTNRKLGLVFEAKVGEGRLLACSIDLQTDLKTRPAARQLRHSLEAYVASEKFDPAIEMTRGELDTLIERHHELHNMDLQIQASSTQPGYGPELAIDGNPRTFWHSSYSRSLAKPPHELVLKFRRPIDIAGVRVYQRADGSANGRITQVVILNDDNQEMARKRVANHDDRISVPLPDNTRTSSLTIRIPEVTNSIHAAIAEIQVVAAP